MRNKSEGIENQIIVKRIFYVKGDKSDFSTFSLILAPEKFYGDNFQ
jgi:hypothetical protein